MTILLLIRNAATARPGNANDCGEHLSDEGWVQAAELPRRLRGVPLDAIYSSPLDRALETAAPLAAERGLEVIPEGQLTVGDFGDWVGSTVLEARAAVTLDQLRRKHDEGVIAVVTQDDVIRAAVSHYAGISVEACEHIAPASISVIQLSDEAPQLCLVNGSGAIANPEAVKERN
jgi:probable phosphoglycerate mutase